MSKVKLILDVVSDLHSLADSLKAVADAVTENEDIASSGQNEKIEKAEDVKKSYTLDEVRGTLANLSRDGFREEVKNILLKYGASKLSDIKSENYGDVMQDAKELIHE